MAPESSGSSVAPPVAPGSGAVDRDATHAGRRLGWQLWIGSIITWWMIGIPFSLLWWLMNGAQRDLTLICYAWEVPVIGWLGAVYLPVRRWRQLVAGHAAGEDADTNRLGRFPLEVASLILATSILGYIVGAVFINALADLPPTEYAKVIVQGVLLGLLFGLAGYLLAERAMYALPAQVDQDAAGASPVHSLYTKLFAMTAILMLGVGVPVFLLNVTQELRRREQVRGESMGRFLSVPQPFDSLPRQARAFGAATVAMQVDSTGRIVDGWMAGRNIRSLRLDGVEQILDSSAGWLANRTHQHSVIAFRHRDGTAWVILSPFQDYAMGLLASTLGSGGLLVGVLLVGLGLAALLAANVVAPLNDLRGRVGEMAQGKRAAIPAALAGGDEVAALSREFARMAMQVQHKEAQLVAVNELLQELQSEVVQAERLSAIGRVVSGVAHELNNPLSAILHFSDDLLLDQGRPPADQEALEAVRAQARRCREIVRDLLAFVRGREQRREPSRVEDLVAQVVTASTPLVDSLEVTLSVRLAEQLPALAVARAGIVQVLLNVVANAAQAAGARGSVTLQAEAQDGGWRIWIEDSGPGIAPEAMPRLFEPFFTTKPVGQGTGLGLAVSLGIVQQHGGTLVGENRAGGGARFTVTLPGTLAARPADDTDADRDRTPVPADVPIKGHVLLVDDETVIRRSLARYFARRGWRVDEAASVEDAELHLGATEYDLILSDLRLGRGSGRQLHDWVKEHRESLLPRFVLMTGDVASSESADFLARTSCLVLEKPFELAALDEVLRRLGQRRR